jgi:tetratricopeptide (TPR) repeat protein
MPKPPDINPFLLAQFNAIAAGLRIERDAASKTVERLLRDTPRESWPSLAEHPELRTAGALERLATLLATHIDRDARYALSVAKLAATVAEQLPDNSYPSVVIAQLRAHALKDLGNVLRTLARHDEAIEALAHAENLLRPFAILAHDLALVRLHLASTYQEVHRFTEAFALIRESKQVFSDHGDSRMVLIAGITEGALLQRLAKYREARETYLLLLVSGPDPETAAALRNNIGLCSIELGDFAEAESNLAESARLYMNELGLPVHALRAQAGYGRLLMRMGNVERAITHLKPIRRAFLGQGLSEEAGICALEIIEGFLTRNKPEDAERLARMVIQEFTRAKLNKRAIIALGYLSRAIAAKKATVPLVQNVRDYILSLRTNPEREFLRPSNFRESE